MVSSMVFILVSVLSLTVSSLNLYWYFSGIISGIPGIISGLHWHNFHWHHCYHWYSSNCIHLKVVLHLVHLHFNITWYFFSISGQHEIIGFLCLVNNDLLCLTNFASEWSGLVRDHPCFHIQLGSIITLYSFVFKIQRISFSS